MTIEYYPDLNVELEADKSRAIDGGSEIDDICNEIAEAAAGWGSDEPRLIKAIGSLTPEMRCKVPVRFEELHGQPLKDLILKECGARDFGSAMQFLAVPPLEAECMMIDAACKGAGTDEKVLCSILCGRTNKEMQLLKKKFFDVYNKDLGTVVVAELKGDLEKLMVMVLQSMEEELDEGYHTDEKVTEDVGKLEECIKSDLDTVFKIIALSPAEHMRKVAAAYLEKNSMNIQRSLVEAHGEGIVEYALSILVGMKSDPYGCACWLANEACKGFGTHELLLTTVIIRFQNVMKQVNTCFEKTFHKTIAEAVEAETKGDYEAILMAVINTGMN